jgi:hypothetical protein
MSGISYERVRYGDREVPASFHDAILKIKDATAKQWISFEADGRYIVPKQNPPMYCAIGYLLPPIYRRQLVDSNKTVRELPSLLGVRRQELEILMGMDLADATAIQNKFDDLSRSFLTVSTTPYVTSEEVVAAKKRYRKEWAEFLNQLLEKENYQFEIE